MVDAGVELALRIKLGGAYSWPEYIADLWRTMSAAQGTEAGTDETGTGSARKGDGPVPTGCAPKPPTDD